MTAIRVPPLKDFYNPVLQAVRNLGGSASRKEILDEVVRNLGLTDEQLETLLLKEDGRDSPLQFRVGFAQTHLKRAGFLENPSLGVWRLSEKGRGAAEVDPDEIAPRRQRRSDEVTVDEPDMLSQNKEQPSQELLAVPTVDRLLNPTLSVMHSLGGSATYEEINDGIADLLELSDDQLCTLHNPEINMRTEFSYRSTFARSCLRKYGLLTYTAGKVWELTEKGAGVRRVNPFAVILHAQHVTLEEKLEREHNIFSDLTDIDQTMSF